MPSICSRHQTIDPACKLCNAIEPTIGEMQEWMRANGLNGMDDEQVRSAWKASNNTDNIDRIKNVKSQLLSTASNPITEQILVDGGTGSLAELLTDAAECLDLTVGMPMWQRGCPWVVTKGGHSICQPPRSKGAVENLGSLTNALVNAIHEYNFAREVTKTDESIESAWNYMMSILAQTEWGLVHAFEKKK